MGGLAVRGLPACFPDAATPGGKLTSAKKIAPGPAGPLFAEIEPLAYFPDAHNPAAYIVLGMCPKAFPHWGL